VSGTTVTSSTGGSALLKPAVLLVGVLLIQLGFIASYVGAFHSPKPRDVPIAVVAPPGAPSEVARESARTINGLDGHPLKATVVADEEAGRDRLRDRKVGGVLLLGERGDRLLVASADGAAESDALEEVVGTVAAQQRRPLTTVDAIPAGKGDARGLGAFYLAVGWVVGGYLASSILGITVGARLSNLRRVAVRLAGMLVYSVLSGLGGAFIVGPWLGALDHGFWPLAAFGTLLVLAVAVFTLALETWLGVIGIGVAIALFVVLGNPSAGGAFPRTLLPPFFSDIGPWLPPGAGTAAIRGIVYFDDAGVRDAALVLLGWLVLGLVGVVAGVASPRQSRRTPERA
jgi:hypothetical protein